MIKHRNRYLRRFLSCMMAIALIFTLSSTCFASLAFDNNLPNNVSYEVREQRALEELKGKNNTVLFVYRFVVDESKTKYRYDDSKASAGTDGYGTTGNPTITIRSIASKTVTRQFGVSGSLSGEITSKIDGAVTAKYDVGISLTSSTEYQETHSLDSSKGRWFYIKITPRLMDVTGTLHTDAYVNGIYQQDVLLTEYSATYPVKNSDGNLWVLRDPTYTNDRNSIVLP